MTCALALAGVFVCFFSATLSEAQRAAQAAAQAAPSPAAPPEQSSPPQSQTSKQKLLWQSLERDIEKAAAEVNGVMAVEVIDLTTGDEISINADEVMPTASSIKIAVLAELLKQAEEGRLKLTGLYTVRAQDLVPDSDIMLGLTPEVTRLTLRDLATMMVAVSDNSATNVLIDAVGFERVNSTLRSLGFARTQLRRKMMDLKAATEGRENVSTARELAGLLRAIHQGKLLDPEHTADFFKLLGTHKSSYMLPALPEDVAAATKPGDLEAVRNETGIVFVKGRPFVISVMGAYLDDPRQGERAITAITRLAFSYFDRVARASPYGRVISPRN